MREFEMVADEDWISEKECLAGRRDGDQKMVGMTPRRETRCVSFPLAATPPDISLLPGLDVFARLLTLLRYLCG